MPGRPEPAPLAGPPVPKEPRPAEAPGTRARRGSPSRGGRGARPPAPCAASAAGTRPAAPILLEKPRPAWNFLQGPLAEAMRGGEGRGTGARLRPEAPVLPTLPGGAAREGRSAQAFLSSARGRGASGPPESSWSVRGCLSNLHQPPLHLCCWELAKRSKLLGLPTHTCPWVAHEEILASRSLVLCPEATPSSLWAEGLGL